MRGICEVYPQLLKAYRLKKTKPRLGQPFSSYREKHRLFNISFLYVDGQILGSFGWLDPPTRPICIQIFKSKALLEVP